MANPASSGSLATQLYARLTILLARCDAAAFHADTQGRPDLALMPRHYARKLRGMIGEKLSGYVADDIRIGMLAGELNTLTLGIHDACEQAETCRSLEQVRARRAALINPHQHRSAAA